MTAIFQLVTLQYSTKWNEKWGMEKLGGGGSEKEGEVFLFRVHYSWFYRNAS